MSPAAGAAGPNLPNASVEELALIHEEFAKAKKQTTNIDALVVVTRAGAFQQALTPDASAVEDGAPELLPAYRFALGQALDDVTANLARRPLAMHEARRYPTSMRALKRKAGGVYKLVRRRARERLTGDCDDAARQRLCVYS